MIDFSMNVLLKGFIISTFIFVAVLIVSIVMIFTFSIINATAVSVENTEQILTEEVEQQPSEEEKQKVIEQIEPDTNKDALAVLTPEEEQQLRDSIAVLIEYVTASEEYQNEKMGLIAYMEGELDKFVTDEELLYGIEENIITREKAEEIKNAQQDYWARLNEEGNNRLYNFASAMVREIIANDVKDYLLPEDIKRHVDIIRTYSYLAREQLETRNSF